jgi:hypothetical protein
MTVVREMAFLKRRRENNIKLEFTTTIYVIRTRAARHIHFHVK